MACQNNNVIPRRQKQMSVICGPPFIVEFLNQSTCTIPSVLFFLYHYGCAVAVAMYGNYKKCLLCFFADTLQALQHDKYRLVEGEVHVITLYESNLSPV